MTPPAKKSFIIQYKDMIQVIYGTAMIVALYFGLSNKIELLSQKHSSDVKLLQYEIDELKENKSAEKKESENNKYALIPNKPRLIITNE